MSNFIVKASRTVDFYVRWSTVSDGPLGWGTRESLLAELNTTMPILNGAARRDWVFGNRTYDRAALDTAEETGSSYANGEVGPFPFENLDETLFFVGEEYSGDISREDFGAFIEALVNANQDDNDPAVIRYVKNIS